MSEHAYWNELESLRRQLAEVQAERAEWKELAYQRALKLDETEAALEQALADAAAMRRCLEALLAELAECQQQNEQIRGENAMNLAALDADAMTIGNLDRELTKVTAERDRLRAALRKIEWSTERRFFQGIGFCPLCDRAMTVGHAPNCPIGLALGEGSDG